MQVLKLYTVSDNYIKFLSNYDKRVSSNKEDNRNFERKYLGTLLNVNNIDYFAPLASPKDTDYCFDALGNKIIRKSIIPIIRIVHKEHNGNIILLGTIKFNNMIPVVSSEIQLYDVNEESDTAYRDLIYKECDFIRSHKAKICKNAQIIYTQKVNKVKGIAYLDNTVDFPLLEQAMEEYISSQEVATTREN